MHPLHPFTDEVLSGGSPKREVQAEDSLSSDSSSQSVSRPPQQVGSESNVGELVAKAKKAAASLWLILHAQNCRMGKDNCPYPNCNETKLLLIHVKTCSAGLDFPCPVKCKGCNETRKLLAHYRRCKDIRMKQVGLGRRSCTRQQQQTQACLVCSLMARHAKNVLDKSKQSSMSNNIASMLVNNSSCLSTDAKFNIEKGFVCVSNSQSSGCKNNGQEIRRPSSESKCQSIERTPSILLMPPPPPRRCTFLSKHGEVSASPEATSSGEVGPGKSPAPTKLMQSRIAAVVAVTDPSNRIDPSLLGKSVDSSCHFSTMGDVPFPDLRYPCRVGEEMVIPGWSSSTRRSTSIRRQRSESFDERKTRVSWAPSCGTSKWQIPAASEHDEFDSNAHNGESNDDVMAPSSEGRPRSASFSHMVKSSRECETIVEGGMEDENVFTMD